MIGAYLQNLLQVGFDNLVETTSSAMQSAHVSDAIRSLVVDGIFTGVGTVLSFLPVIVVLFYFCRCLKTADTWQGWHL